MRALKLATVLALSAASSLADWHEVEMEVRGYCACKICCGHTHGITSYGLKAQGRVVAAPKTVPFLTVVRVPGYGEALVLDRGKAVFGRRLEVFFSTHKEAREWGVKRIRVKFLKLPLALSSATPTGRRDR